MTLASDPSADFTASPKRALPLKECCDFSPPRASSAKTESPEEARTPESKTRMCARMARSTARNPVGRVPGGCGGGGGERGGRGGARPPAKGQPRVGRGNGKVHGQESCRQGPRRLRLF